MAQVLVTVSVRVPGETEGPALGKYEMSASGEHVVTLRSAMGMLDHLLDELDNQEEAVAVEVFEASDGQTLKTIRPDRDPDSL